MNIRPTDEFFEAYHRVFGADAEETPAAVIGALRNGHGDLIREELAKLMDERRAKSDDKMAGEVKIFYPNTEPQT